MDCHFLLQGIFPTQRSNLGLLHCRQTLYHLRHQGSPKHTCKVDVKCRTKILLQACLCSQPKVLTGRLYCPLTHLLNNFSYNALRGACKTEMQKAAPASRESQTVEKATQVAQMKNLPAMQKILVPSLGWEDALEEGMAIHSSILAWNIP